MPNNEIIHLQEGKYAIMSYFIVPLDEKLKVLNNENVGHPIEYLDTSDLALTPFEDQVERSILVASSSSKTTSQPTNKKIKRIEEEKRG